MERGISKRGRKKGDPLVKWDDRLAHMAFQFAILGATDKELATAFEVGVDTISRWKRTHPEFQKSYSEGKVEADAQVAYSHFKTAIGCEYFEEQIVRGVNGPGTYEKVKCKKYAHPNPWSAWRWLEFRRGWTTIQRYEVKNTNTNVDIDYSKLTPEQLNAVYALYQAANENKRLE